MACRGHSSTVLLHLLSFTLLFHFTPHAAAREAAREAIRGAYWPTDMNFPPSSINSSYFTHVYYAFVQPDSTSYQLKITSSDDQILSTFAATLHSLKPPLKALLSMNGLDEVYGKLVSIPSARETFIQSTISVARQYGLDGLDLDWEFPLNTVEMDNFGLLYTEWRAAINKEAEETGQPPLLLTSAVYFTTSLTLYSNVQRSYPVKTMDPTVDWVNVMCFDYHGSWDTTETGALAALYDYENNISTSYGINSWIDAGMPPEKIVMGLPLYGRSWKLEEPTVHGIGAPAVGAGPGIDGFLFYFSLVDFIKANNATVVYDETTVSEYAYEGTDWIGYDGPRSVTGKIEFARGRNAGGYFFWALGYEKDWRISKIAYDAWADRPGDSS